MDRFKLGEYLSKKRSESPGTKAIRVAVVGSLPIIDPARFGETVARNRGVIVKVTTELEDALSWLGVDPANNTT